MFDGLLRFQISKKWANLRFPLNIRKQKVFQLQGGFASDQGLCPWTPLEAPSQTPYRLALRALAMAPLDCGPPAGRKLTKWPAVSKRLYSTDLEGPDLDC